jgi:DNA repair ATPase RecN
MISSEIVKDLNTKSIDELLFIYFNQDDYVYEFTQKIRTNNEKLLQEVSELSENTEKLKSQYEDIKLLVNNFKDQYLEKENELKELYSQKQLIDSNFTVEKLIEEMRKAIEENYQKPRQKLINEFLSKKIDMETFKESFKELSVKYHYYNLIKDKLNLYK